TDEVKIGEGEILMISMVCGDFKKIITWDKNNEKEIKLSKDINDYVEYVEDEAELIEKFVEYVKDISPDFLTGYFSDGFDLPYIKARAEKFNMKLPLSLDGTQPRFSRGGGILTGKIKGLPHIDLWKFIKTTYSQYLNSETLSLDEVSKELLGDRKEEFKIKHSSTLDNSDWENYYRYNLQDSVLTYDLFMKVWKDLAEFTRIIKAPVVEVSKNGMSTNVETYILNNLEEFNEIPEKRPVRHEILERRKKGKYEGAFVYEPTPGMYENIVMFDFTSSYASVIVSYNLSKSTFVPEPSQRKDEEYFEINTENETMHFEKQEGFIPQLLKDIIQKRKQYKKELKKNPDNSVKRARSNAFKLLANSYYGYQGFFGARYYCREAAAATAAFAKKSIKDVMEKIREKGYETVYGDTDSIALLQGKSSKKEIMELLKELNSELPGIMELESEGFFKRGIWVTKRTGKTGAKKKYALIDQGGRIKIRGFETVRRDWCSLARHVQNKVIELVLEYGDEKKALDFLKKVVKNIKNREVKKEELVIKTQLKKPLSEYKAVSPHVIAARKMKEKEIPIKQGGLVEYYVAESNENKKLVRERVKLPFEEGNYDIEYYLNHQILPAVENILKVFDINIKEIIEGKKQTTLGDF
ncbi:MAG TPA: DNA-directed DNA polymerase, partial [Candidatus Nanoarchaeia archaeon]|nr:DNA-directed DNA polymerase [Candidatus Nanoarchaeia archaeon]